MKRSLESSRCPVSLAIVSLTATATAAFVWGTVSAVSVVAGLIQGGGQPPLLAAEQVVLQGTFMLAAAMVPFALGLTEPVIGGLKVPARLVLHNLHDLKPRLASVVILVMGVTFLEHLIEWADPAGPLYLGRPSPSSRPR